MQSFAKPCASLVPARRPCSDPPTHPANQRPTYPPTVHQLPALLRPVGHGCNGAPRGADIHSSVAIGGGPPAAPGVLLPRLQLAPAAGAGAGQVISAPWLHALWVRRALRRALLLPAANGLSWKFWACAKQGRAHNIDSTAQRSVRHAPAPLTAGCAPQSPGRGSHRHRCPAPHWRSPQVRRQSRARARRCRPRPRCGREEGHRRQLGCVKHTRQFCTLLLPCCISTCGSYSTSCARTHSACSNARALLQPVQVTVMQSKPSRERRGYRTHKMTPCLWTISSARRMKRPAAMMIGR